MAETRKVLGQAALTASTLTDVYTVPAVTQAVGSSVVIANLSSTPTTFRLSIAVAGASNTPKQYIYYDVPLPGNNSFTATIGITLGAADVVRAYSPGTNVSVSVFGVEIT